MEHWLGVELRHLAALAAVDRERSFRSAAERLGYVQSAVSQQISQLEQLVNARLVDRSPGQSGVALTESGRLLLLHADRILSHLEAAHADLRALSEGAASTLRIGIYQSLATRLLPRVLTLLWERAPDLCVETTEAFGDAALFEAVARGELDAAFAELPLEPGPFDQCELLVDPTVLIVPGGSPLVECDGPPTLAQIAALPLIAHPVWRLFPAIQVAFATAGLAPHFRISSNTNSAVQALVASGLGAAIMPRLALDLDNPATRVIDLTHVLPARTLVLYWHRERLHRRVIEPFCDAAREASAGLDSQRIAASASAA